MNRTDTQIAVHTHTLAYQEGRSEAVPQRHKVDLRLWRAGRRRPRGNNKSALLVQRLQLQRLLTGRG